MEAVNWAQDSGLFLRLTYVLGATIVHVYEYSNLVVVCKAVIYL